MIRRFLRWAGYLPPNVRAIAADAVARASADDSWNRARSQLAPAPVYTITHETRAGDGLRESMRQIALPGECIHTRRDADGHLWSYNRYPNPMGD